VVTGFFGAKVARNASFRAKNEDEIELIAISHSPRGNDLDFNALVLPSPALSVTAH